MNPVPKPKMQRNKNSRHITNKKPDRYEPCEVDGCPGRWESTHEVFGGALRNWSIRNGMQAHLCNNHHTGKDGVDTGNTELDLMLKRKYQRIYEAQHGHESFMKSVGRNYGTEQ
jgi:hypothetical protein